MIYDIKFCLDDGWLHKDVFKHCLNESFTLQTVEKSISDMIDLIMFEEFYCWCLPCYRYIEWANPVNIMTLQFSI